MTNSEHDEDGFPVACEENEGTLFQDPLTGLLWVCVYEDHPEIRDYCWKAVQ
jgi:hypothetical protein